MERLVVSPFVHVRKRPLELLLAEPTRAPGTWWLLRSDDDGSGSWKLELDRLEVEEGRLLADEL
jgi:hypothetical protein